ncbi:hypothetical protein F511_32079 [Dorcoceras hygrometricum]|uniref:Retrotransposon gag domain-containing protein n=1 Tax=Dorcoceras hygrometricum TaxID=472368 RepID=A0A2Z7C4W9_9LAMI|nr:hypothetical protein F511_32079 [Dorcoceras hygrometricum]
MTPVATPYGLGDASPQSITVHKLTGRNFIPWSQSVMMYICGRGKDDFLTGLVPRHDAGDPKLLLWKAKNNMVMLCLINSMTPEIDENFLLYPTAKDIWDATREAYSCKDNSAELFAIETTLQILCQGENTVTAYFTKLTRLWQQLDMFELFDWKYPQDKQRYKSIIEQRRLFKFLLGINNDLDDVRGRILGINPLPSL